MKNPKWRCAYPNSHKVKFGGKFLTQWDGYHLTLEQSTGGTISADKLKGYQEQSANLSYTANQDYYFNGWQSTGANIQNNQVPFTADTTAKGSFVYTNPNRVVHETISNSVANASSFYRWNGGNSNDLLHDMMPGPSFKTSANHGYSGEYLNAYHAIHYKFKNAPITLDGYSSHFFDFRTYGIAGEEKWYNGTGKYNQYWELDQYNGKVYFNDAVTPKLFCDVLKHYATLSSNRFPMFKMWLNKTSGINTKNGELIDGTVYAKCDDWTTKENDLKYLILISGGNKYDHNYDRTCYVSAYFDNKFIGSAWEGVYNVLYKTFITQIGLFSATTETAQSGYYISTTSNHRYGTYTVYRPVAGSAQVDVANFGNANDAKRWLDSL